MKALQQHYANLTPDEVKLKRADFIGHNLIPTLASAFVACYWILGMMKYNSPDWSAYTFLVPDFQACFWKYVMMNENTNYVYSRKVLPIKK